MTKPASPRAVEHRVTRLTEAAEHLLLALDSGAPLDVEQAAIVRNAALLVLRRADEVLPVAVSA